MGIWVVVLPFLGFPYSWQDVLTSLSGLALVYVSFALYKESRKNEAKEEEKFDNFSENKFMSESEL